MDSEGFAVGIDLGTTYSCIALYRKGRVKILSNDEGNLTTSSCVAFTDTVRLIGDEAKTQVVLNPENTIFNSKRMIGRKFNDPKIQQDLQYWQFKVLNKLSKPKIRVEFEGMAMTFTPEEISAMVLTEMKENAEMYIVKKVTDVVISVPACFNDSQRQATINAARIAGLNVIKLITEPAAAAVAYRAENKFKGTKNVLIYDLGGGKLDVSVINISEDWQFEVKTTAGDSHLGGEDFDNVLVAHFVEEFKTKHQRDLRTCPKALRRLRIECEYAKWALSSCLEVRIDINCLFAGISFHSKLTRGQFEDLCNDLFQSTLKPVKRALFDAEMAKGSIDEVVLVGVSTRIPKIRELLKDFFDGKEPLVSVSPDEAVVYGAAVQAAVLSGLADEELDSFRLVDVSPYSLLIETDKGGMSTLIHRNSQIPCVTTKVFSTEVDNQCSIVTEVYEGEQATAKDNRLLGRFCVEGIPLALKGVPQVEVKFQLDANGILDVSAESSKTPRIEVTADKGGLSTDEVDEMHEEAKRCEEEEAEKRERNWAIEELVSYVYSVKLMVEYTSDYALSESDRDMALVICDAFLDWIEDNPLEETGDVLDAIKRAKADLSRYIDMVERERVR